MSRKTTMFKRASLVAAVGLAVGASGCAEERESINQVQPDVLDKSFFIGKDLVDSSDDPEFYAQGTLIDVGYGASQSGLFTSTYAQPLSRIKWVVQEKELIGRLTYERIDNTDGKGVGPLRDEGQVVAVYPIVKHFDIQKQYNPTTGEELNVIVENSTDRPWNERKYFRVDWSKNTNTDSYDYDTLSQLGVYGGVKYEPLDYYINDPKHPDAPKFDIENGYFDVTNKAFAVPGMVDLSHLGWGIKEFPACFLPNDFAGGTAPVGNCNPVELTIRQAFRRVEKTDYEPKNWDGYRFQAFGAFLVERQGYERNYGMTDDRWYRFVTRYNIWERHHYYNAPETMEGAIECFTPSTTPVGEDANRDEDGNGTADECEGVTAATGVAGSQCDTFTQKCTLPYAERTPVATPWYYTSGSNQAPEYWESTQWATHEWDVALRASVQSARYAECVSTGGDQASCSTEFPVYFGQQNDNRDAIDLAREVDDCRNGVAYENQDCNALADSIGTDRGYDPGVIALAKMDEMIVLCHSPVEANDPAACGGPRLPAGLTAAACHEHIEMGHRMEECDAALNVRRGDLRYHQVNMIKQPQTPSPWGIYTDAEDPLTGETVSASINVWTHVGDFASQNVVDIARYVKGELSTEDVTEGTYIHEWSKAAEAATRHGAIPPMSQEELDRRAAGFAGVSVEKLEEIRAIGEHLPANVQGGLAKLRHEVKGIRADLYAPSTNRTIYDARRKEAMGSSIEAQLTTKAMQQLAGVNSMPSADLIAQYASPLRGANPSVVRDMRHFREMALAERGSCVLHEAPAPVSFTNIAKALEEKFGNFDATQDAGTQIERAEKMRKYVAAKMNYNVVAHEMGHSIGLRHNFVSSSDAWGYRPQYWQLRTKNGTNTQECVDTDGNLVLDPTGACVGPRYVDPITDEERDGLLWMFMQSTVMDYAGEYTQDFIGLGVYDFAAARAFYGDVVAVHADESYNVRNPRGTGMLSKMDNFGGITGFSPTIGVSTGSTNTEDFHYSQYNAKYDLISNCRAVEPDMTRPATYDEDRHGEWHPTLDGLLVEVDQAYSICDQQKVDYVPWNSLRMPVTNDSGTPGAQADVNFSRSGPAIDPEGRTRVPYGFATDRWADLGNLSVYRHDNGADAYELFDFFITQQETNHIFDNYRRNRTTFSVRSAAYRTLGRYNEKLRDAAKGLGLMKNIYTEFALELGYDSNTLWPFIADANFRETMLASGLAFDHFTRQLSRPQPGNHFRPTVAVNIFTDRPTDTVLRSDQDTYVTPGPTVLTVPNGATGRFGVVQYGGKPIENALASDKGEYDSEYTINAGSYYDKAFSAMLMTESYDNFISDSRRDFTDARYRAVSLADLFPDGFRRWLANNLTNDDTIRGVRVVGSLTETKPFASIETDAEGYPTFGLGYTTWWGSEGPQTCFAEEMSLLCSNNSAGTVVIDPQVGYEQQKFLIAWTLLYLPENNKQTWLNKLWLWELGADSDPGFQNRIEFHDPNGRVYIAKTFGTETIYTKEVQQGISARILEYANELLEQGYETTAIDNDGNGVIDWYVPVLGADGQPVVKFDPSIRGIGPDGSLSTGRDGCNETDNSDCGCTENRACMALENYTQVPHFLREAIGAYGLGHPSMKGIY